ncbi:hypothetical protein FHS29_002992 [Saccharothrix tamanrassetensis]|uniref:Uncharacterized protein n=1 Tax=Saccharothrix tamanrassetensis TaxID=1051531 RepID=A0A841CLE6_9PSEU|nr:hypothetical protein [Saccharothrix tamanrassetensis]MBB5956406.1 hypothetical protein [Saccharothrix tamanrassetensis]
MLDSLPKRDEVAQKILANADWSNGMLQVRTSVNRFFDFDLKVPSLGEALDLVLRSAGLEYSLSDKGRIGAALSAKSSVLVEDGVFEAVAELTTPRSKELVKQLRSMRERGDEDAEMMELAARWGGRAERRYRTAADVKGLAGYTAMLALEALCNLNGRSVVSR